MKLSDAIMLNGMTKPQGYGCESVASTDAPCAIGGALQAVGKQVTHDTTANYPIFFAEWPWAAKDTNHVCPVCINTIWGEADMIWHLNDFHHWTRHQIAEWVQSVEPQEAEQSEIESVCEVVNELP